MTRREITHCNMSNIDEVWDKIVEIAYGTDLHNRHYVDLEDLRPVFDEIATQAKKEERREIAEHLEAMKVIVLGDGDHHYNQALRETISYIKSLPTPNTKQHDSL